MEETAIKSIALLVIGIAFIAIGINVIRMYMRSAVQNPRQLMFWDLLSVLFTGPWSFPVGLAAIIIAMGLLAAFFGTLAVVTVVL